MTDANAAIYQALAATSTALTNEQKVSADLRKKLNDFQEQLEKAVKKEKEAAALLKKIKNRALQGATQAQEGLSMANTVFRPIVIKFGEDAELNDIVVKVNLGKIADGTIFGAKVAKSRVEGKNYNIKTFFGNGCLHIDEQGYTCNGRDVDSISDVIGSLTSLKENLPSYLTDEKVKQIREIDQESIPAGLLNALTAALNNIGVNVGTPMVFNIPLPRDPTQTPTTPANDPSDDYIPDDE